MLYGTIDSQENIGGNTYPNVLPSLSLNFDRCKTIDPRITFSRNSTATYVDKDGYIHYSSINSPRIEYDANTSQCLGLLLEEQRTNLLLGTTNYSPNNFVWSSGNPVTPIYGAALSPDGSYSATQLNFLVNGYTALITAIGSVTANIIYTASGYYKAGTANTVTLALGKAGTMANQVYAIFDLNSGVITSQAALNANSSSNSAFIINAGNGWYRCGVTGIVDNSSTTLRIDTVNTTNANKYIYIWGPQLEAGSFPTSYIPSTDTFVSRNSTGTFIGSNGYIQTAAANTARYSYNPLNLSISPTLLLETSSTNYVPYSTLFSNGWTNYHSNTYTTTITSPDGTTNASKLCDNNESTTHNTRLSPLVPIVSGTTLTASVFAQKAELNQFALSIGDSTNGANWTYTIFDTSNGNIVLTSSSTTNVSAPFNSTIIPYNNGWYRCSITCTVTDSNAQMFIFTSNYNTLSYTGSNNGIYIYGAQLEMANGVSSYIPTTSTPVTRFADVSTSAQSTRIADLAYMTGTNFSSWYNPSQWTMYTETSTPYGYQQNACAAVFEPNDVQFALFGGGRLIPYRNLGVAIGQYEVNPAKYNKTIATWNSANNIITGTANGSVIASSSPPSLIYSPLMYNTTNFNSLYFGRALQSATWVLNGHIKNFIYYPVSLSNTQIQTLTAL